MIRLLVSLLVLFPGWVLAQDAELPLDEALHHAIDRLTIHGQNDAWSFLRPLPREELSRFFIDLDTVRMGVKMTGWYRQVSWLHVDSGVESRTRHRWFWANQRDLLSFSNRHVQVYLNPLLHAGFGYENFRNRANQSEDQALLANLRGASLRIKLFNQVGLYTEVLENQWLYPDHLRELSAQRNVPPGGGFNKPYRTRGFDFLNAKAYITYSPAQFIRIKLGRDRVHYGPGVQSLLLSDWATDAYALQTDWRVWKLRYHQRFAQLIDFIPGKADVAGDYPRKYGVWHQLAFQPIPQVEIALFESVIYADQLPNSRRGFELQYLNPLIFYRSVEQAIGSPDNGFMGLQIRVDALRRYRVYGQLVVDDFNFAQRKNGRNWWGNKYGWQVGVKYIDVLGLDGLDFQLECNRIRPYLYSHFNTAAAYAHFGQPLAHPFGANLMELIGIVRWVISPVWVAILDASILRQGIDELGRNYGADIYRSNLIRNNGNLNPDFENTTLQGSRRQVARLGAVLSWQLGRLPAWLDVQFGWRKDQSSSTRLDWRPRSDFFGSIQLRWMMPYRRSLY